MLLMVNAISPFRDHRNQATWWSPQSRITEFETAYNSDASALVETEDVRIGKTSNEYAHSGDSGHWFQMTAAGSSGGSRPLSSGICRYARIGNYACVTKGVCWRRPCQNQTSGTFRIQRLSNHLKNRQRKPISMACISMYEGNGLHCGRRGVDQRFWSGRCSAVLGLGCSGWGIQTS